MLAAHSPARTGASAKSQPSGPRCSAPSRNFLSLTIWLGALYATDPLLSQILCAHLVRGMDPLVLTVIAVCQSVCETVQPRGAHAAGGQAYVSALPAGAAGL